MSQKKDQTDRDVDDLLTAMVRLWAEAPPLVRWRALRELADNRANLQAMTVHQLLPDETDEGARRGVGAVARLLGVTTSWVSQLAALPRRHAGLFAWGRALAVASELVALAERAPSTRLSDELSGIVRRGLHDTSPRTDLEHAASRWAMAARRQRRGPEADALVDRLEKLLADVTPAFDLDWLARAEIALGFQASVGAGHPGVAAVAAASATAPRTTVVPAAAARPAISTLPVPAEPEPPADPVVPPAAEPSAARRRAPGDPLPWTRYRLRDR
jgi:hypothetical protein